MSIEAMSWVLKQDISRSSEKFILICLANYADERGICYPSTETLARNTGQDRKTVMLNIKRLIECGHLADTGHRVGRTKSVPVYELVGMPGNSDVHYVYKTTNLVTGEFYIGKRSFNGNPALDTYRGSGRWVIAAQSKGITLHKEIIEIFDTDVEARACEMRLFKEEGIDRLCRNEGTPAALRRNTKCTHRNDDAPPELSSAENGIASDDAGSSTVFPGSSTVFPSKQYRFSAEAVPKTGHRTIKEPPIEPSRNHKPREKSAEPVFSPLDALLDLNVDSQVAADWLKLRKQKKATVTQTALDGLAKEAAVAGLDMDGALRVCCSRGWVGFEASWLAPRNAGGPAKAAGGQGGSWWASDSAILAKGMELGLRPQAGESMSNFKGRIESAIARANMPIAAAPPPPVPAAPVGAEKKRTKPEGLNLKSLVGRAPKVFGSKE